MIVRRTIDKDELKELPKVVFPGRIHVIQSESEKAVAYPVVAADIGYRQRNAALFHKRAITQSSASPDFFRRMLFSVPAQYDGTYTAIG